MRNLHKKLTEEDRFIRYCVVKRAARRNKQHERKTQHRKMRRYYKEEIKQILEEN